MTQPVVVDAADEQPARVPWRKNLLWLFGLAYVTTGALYGADLVAQAEIDDYTSHGALLIEAFKVLSIGTIAVAKDMIR